MKKVTKIMATVVATAIMMSSAGVVLAAEATDEGIASVQQTTTQTKTGSGLERLQQALAKREEVMQYRPEFEAKKEAIKSQREENKQLREGIKADIKQVRDKIKELRKSPDGLTADKINSIKESLSLLIEDKEQLKSSLGQVKDEFNQVKESRKNRDFQAALTELDNIISIQNQRNTELKKLQADVAEVLNDLN